MNEHYKKTILLIVKDMEKEIGKNAMQSLFDSGSNQNGEKKVGCNQFREIANDCRVADCYEEILLLVQYTEAKSKNDVSWKTKCDNGKTFGQTVVAGMEKVCQACGVSEWEKKQEVLQLYFGYLYWQSRVWADMQPLQQHGGNGGRPNFNRNNNRR